MPEDPRNQKGARGVMRRDKKKRNLIEADEVGQGQIAFQLDT
ncbi:hypothetical protein [Thiocapsa imhoffii]|nr:hypothetical protein [Thiocapsa imhoffii]